MKECDIFRGSKHTLTPHTYYQGSQDPLPQDLHFMSSALAWRQFFELCYS